MTSVLPTAILSIGWTTNVETNKTVYSLDHIKNMIKTIEENRVAKTHPITFTVRAAIAAQTNPCAIQRLLYVIGKSHKTTITFWSHKDDKVDVKRLQDLINRLGINNVYVDVSHELKEKLNLEPSPTTTAKPTSIPNPNGASVLGNIILLNVAAFLISLFLKNRHFWNSSDGFLMKLILPWYFKLYHDVFKKEKKHLMASFTNY